VRDAPVNPRQQPCFLVCREFLKSRHDPLDDDEAVPRRDWILVAGNHEQLVFGEDSFAFDGAKASHRSVRKLPTALKALVSRDLSLRYDDLAILGHESVLAQREQASGVLLKAVRIVLKDFGGLLRGGDYGGDCVEVKFGESRQIEVEVRQHIVLAGVRRQLHRCQIPEQIVNNEAPRQEVVDGEAVTKLPPGVDVAELSGLPHIVEVGSHSPPEVASGGELPRRRRTELVQHTRHVWVSCLQVEREVMLGEGLDDAEVLHQECAPRVVKPDGFTRTAGLKKVERSERRLLAVSRQRLDFRVFQLVPDSAQFFVEPRRQKARRDIPLEIIELRLCSSGTLNKAADGVGRDVRLQAGQLLNLHYHVLKFVLPSERQAEKADRMPRSNRHLGEHVRYPQRTAITPFEQRQHGEEPNQFVGVGRVLENLAEKESFLRVAERDACECGRLTGCAVLSHRLRGAYTQLTANAEQSSAKKVALYW